MNQIKYLFLGIKDCRRFLLGTETILQIQPYSEILQTYNYLENLNILTKYNINSTNLSICNKRSSVNLLNITLNIPRPYS